MKTSTIGFIAAGLLAGLATAPARAECTRTIDNKTSLTALVSRNRGPWVTVPPHSSQAIRYSEPGAIEVALVCAPPGNASPTADAVFRSSYSYQAILDRCYFEIGNGFFEDQLGPGFALGTRDTAPLTVNTPRQGDVVIGPRVDAQCAVSYEEPVRSRY